MRSRMSTWFETKVRYTKAQEDGSEKPVTEAYITAGVVTYARRHEAATQTNIMRVINIE